MLTATYLWSKLTCTMRQFLLISFILSIAAFHVARAEHAVSLSGGINLASKQYWRGVVYSNAPVVQPEISLNAGRFTLTFWGSQAVDFNYSEINIIPTYSMGDVSLTIYDYYNPVKGAYNHYLDFSDSTNRHSTELLAAWEPAQLPLKILAATFFYNDKNPLSGKPNFSTYIEAGVPFVLGAINAEISLGMTPFCGYYAASAALIQARAELSRVFLFKHGCSLPVSLSFNANPSLRTMNFLLNVGFFIE